MTRNERSWAELGHSGLLFQKTIHFCSNFPVSWWLGLLNTLFICGDMTFAIVWSFFVRLRRPLPWPCWRAEAMLSTPNIITYCLSSPNQSIAFKALYLKSLRVLLKIIKFESCFAALICTRIWWCNVIRLANFGQLYCSYIDIWFWIMNELHKPPVLLCRQNLRAWKSILATQAVLMMLALCVWPQTILWAGRALAISCIASQWQFIQWGGLGHWQTRGSLAASFPSAISHLGGKQSFFQSGTANFNNSKERSRSAPPHLSQPRPAPPSNPWRRFNSGLRFYLQAYLKRLRSHFLAVLHLDCIKSPAWVARIDFQALKFSGVCRNSSGGDSICLGPEHNPCVTKWQKLRVKFNSNIIWKCPFS